MLAPMILDPTTWPREVARILSPRNVLLWAMRQNTQILGQRLEKLRSTGSEVCCLNYLSSRGRSPISGEWFGRLSTLSLIVLTKAVQMLESPGRAKLKWLS